MVTLDTEPPTNANPIEFSAPFGSHLDVGTAEESLTVTWNNPPFDGSGTQVTLIAGNYFSQTIYLERELVPITTTTKTFIVPYSGDDKDGGFYVMVGAIDHAGNKVLETFGPWIGSNVRSESNWTSTLQSIFLDGEIEIETNEWLTETELLDWDVRPAVEQRLYATWDGARPFVGWEGAWWETDGDMWVYHDVLNGGSNQPAVGSNITLPFDADYAFQIIDDVVAYEWTWDAQSATWQSKLLDGLDETISIYAYSPEFGETEMTFGLSSVGSVYKSTETYDHHRMIAFAVDNAGEIWSAFPTSNGLDGNFKNFYEWHVTTGTDLLKLPDGARVPAVIMNVTSDPPVQETVSTDDFIQYVVEISNIKDTVSTGVQLDLAATPGLSFSSVGGASCNSCASGDAWLLDVPAIPLDASQRVTITAQLDSDLTGITAVTNTIKLQSALIELPAVDTISHIVDIDPPIVTVATLPDNVLSLNTATINGLADDSPGTGVDLVEVSVAGGAWQPATGTIAWTANIVTLGSDGSLQVDVRATDYHGNISAPLTINYNVDGIAPVITPTVPALVGGSGSVTLVGTTEDPSPASGLVESVEVQFDDANNAWDTANLGFGDPQEFLFNWLLPPEEGITHTVRFRATDFAGNVTTSIWYNSVVDTKPPIITVTQHLTEVSPIPATPVLVGTLVDGYAVGSVTIIAYPETGAGIEETATLVGNDWSYTPTLPGGIYSLYVQGKDAAGNSTLLGPFALINRRADVFVDDSWASQTDVNAYNPGLTWQYDAFNTVQDGIDNTQTDSTLTVLDGIYTESVSIGRSMTIIGLNGAANTILQASVIPNDAADRVLFVSSSSDELAVTLQGFTIRYGVAPESFNEWGDTVLLGGGVYNGETLTLTSVIVTENKVPPLGEYTFDPGFGGGIFNSGTLTIIDSTISNNIADSGAGISNRGSLTVHRSTITGNQGFIVEGGGISNYGPDVTINNSTFSNNLGGGNSGDIMANEGVITITSSTFNGSNGNLFSNGGSFVVNNSILANSSPNCMVFGSGSISGSNNLIDDAACGTAGIIGAVTNFDTTLADNGGPTWTHALLPGSSAIDAGINSCPDDTGTPLATDQRGVVRPLGVACDIGAFELASGNTAPVAVDDSVTTAEDTAVTIDVLANDSDVEGDNLSLNNITTAPISGTAVISGSFIVYTPPTTIGGTASPSPDVC